MNTSLEEQWLYSVRQWCSENHTYFQLVRSASPISSTSRMNISRSRSGSCASGPGR